MQGCSHRNVVQLNMDTDEGTVLPRCYALLAVTPPPPYFWAKLLYRVRVLLRARMRGAAPRINAPPPRAHNYSFCARPPLPAGHLYAMAQRSSADGNERNGVTGKSDSVKRPREGHSELPREAFARGRQRAPVRE